MQITGTESLWAQYTATAFTANESKEVKLKDVAERSDCDKGTLAAAYIKVKQAVKARWERGINEQLGRY